MEKRNIMSNGSYLIENKAREINRIFGTRWHPSGYISFQFDLPFELPFENEKFIVSFSEKAALISKRRSLTKPDTEEKIFYSRVEIIDIQLSALPSDISEELLTVSFGKCLEFLNKTIDSLSLVHKIENIRNVSEHDLSPVIIAFIFKSIKIDEKRMHTKIFIQPYSANFLETIPSLNSNQMNELVGFINNQNSLDFSKMVRYHRKAIYDINHGLFQEGIIKLQTFVEMFVSKICKEMLIIHNKNTQYISNIIDGPYKNRLVDHFGKYLSNATNPMLFDIDDPQSAAFDYWNHVYKMRNSIVHKGYSPTMSDSAEAATSTKLFIDKCLKTINADSKLKNIPNIQFLIFDK